MQIINLTSRYMEENCYLLVEQKHVIIIDPGDAEIVLKALNDNNFCADFGILTHEHCDHIYGCSKLREKLGIKFYSSENCDKNMQDSQKNFSKYFEAFIEIQTKIPTSEQKSMPPFTEKADIIFNNELLINWMGHKIYMKETPGHSSGSICILIDDEKMFSGDTLFYDEETVFKFPGGNKTKLKTTLNWFESLPKDIKIYPGHGCSFILGERLKRSVI